VSAKSGPYPRLYSLCAILTRRFPRHHRLLLLTHLPPPIPLSTVRAELAFISRSLLPDAKNYHTWAYRQFVLSHFGAALTEDDWAEERAWTDALLRVETGAASLTALEGENDEEGDWEEEEIGEGHRGDVRNNSAWGHRWFLYFGRADAPGEAALNDEIE
jgi:protein farnesyltransferase/geranylgeranyltransferase type-1 subunit alpha